MAAQPLHEPNQAGKRHRRRIRHQRQDESEALELRQLILERPVRQLQRPGNRAAPTVGLEDLIELQDGFVQ